MTPPRHLRPLTALLVSLLLSSPAPAQDIVQKLYDNALQLLRNGKSQEALKGFEQIAQTYGRTTQAPDALYQIATYQYPAADVDDLGAATRDQILKTIPVLERIRKDYGTSPRVPEALYKLGLLALEPDNPRANPNEAYAAFASVANVYPDSPVVGNALFGAAVSQMRSGAFGDAVEEFSRLLEQISRQPLAARARLALGYCLYRTGDSERAMEEYQKVRDLNPGKPEADEALARLTLMHRLRILPAAGTPVTYRADGDFPGRLETLGLRSVTALAVGPTGDLLVADGKQGTALILDPRGRAAGKVAFPDPQAAARDRKGSPVLAGGGAILVGMTPRPLTRPDGSSPRIIREVSGLGVDRDGRIYLTDRKENDVLLYGRALDFRASLHRAAAGRLVGLRIGFDNQVYLLDSREKSVTVFADGKQTRKIRLMDPPASVSDPVAFAVDDLGDLYLCDGSTGRIVVLDPSGKTVLATLKGERGKGGLSSPQQIEVDHQGRIYVYDGRADAILRFS